MKATLVSFFLILGLLGAAADSASSEETCAAYQLDYYRSRYADSQQCWAGEQGYKGATEYCCRKAFGLEAAPSGEAELAPQPQEEAPAPTSVTANQNRPAKEYLEGLDLSKLGIKTEAWPLSEEVSKQCFSQHEDQLAYHRCYVDVTGRLLLTNEPAIAAKCTGLVPPEKRPDCATAIYELFLEARRTAMKEPEGDEKFAYWCPNDLQNYMGGGYYTQPGEGCNAEARLNAVGLDQVRREIAKLRAKLITVETDEETEKIQRELKEAQARLNRLLGS
jgi:hypothetical protein